MTRLIASTIPWFLWSIVYSSGSHERDSVAQPVKEYASQAACEKGLVAYQKEVDKAFPNQPFESDSTSVFITQPFVVLRCSPVYPK